MSSLYRKFNDLSTGQLAHGEDSVPSSSSGGALSSSSKAAMTHRASNGSITTRSSAGALSAEAPNPLSKPLLHILDHGEMPGDMAIIAKLDSFHPQSDVYITRAEMELKKAMQSLSFMTNSEINSVTTLTAMSLPKVVTPLFWTIRALLQEKYQRPNDRNRIHHRNQDARLLFHQLARLNLRNWSKQIVGYIRADELPDNLRFPPGHPVRGQTYRRHPFKSRWTHYYPVADYFSMLFEERERALLTLLGDLGATKITMTTIPPASDINGQAINSQAAIMAQLKQKVFSYPKQDGPLPTAVNLQRHPWLAGEPAWQAMVRERIERRALSAQFEFDSDVMGMLKAQLKMIGQLVPGLNSMVLSDNYDEQMRSQVLKTRQVKVEFCEMQPAAALP